MTFAQSEGESRPTTGVAVALDIGGSKTLGIRIANGDVVEEQSAGSANVQNVPRELAARQLEDLLRRLGAHEADEIVVGSGGVDTPDDELQLRMLVAPHAPQAAITVVHDTRLILAAGAASTGIAVIAGTGSAAWGINDEGVQARAGGWGYLLGDEGSGYWLGRETVRHSLDRFDRGQSEDALTTAVLGLCGASSPAELIALFHRNADRRYWAELSRLVFDAAEGGHPESVALIERAGEHLACLTVTVADRLGMTGPVVLGGGLGTNQPALRGSFVRHLEGHGITDVRTLTVEPVYGALRLLRSHASMS